MIRLVLLITVPTPEEPPSGAWVLATGVWDDSGIWDDDAMWVDEPIE